MNTTPPRRVAIYARLSVDRDGNKVGIDTQLTDSRELARTRGWQVVGEYVDRNLTAADKLVKRPEYDKLVQAYAAGQFSALICWDLDRLTRQPRQLEDWIDAAEDRHLSIVTANGEADLSTDSGRLFARMKAAVGKAETERASARQQRNKQYRREHGLFHGGPAPFGYRVENKTLVPVPHEVALIEDAIHRLLEDREPLHSIVTDWNTPSEPGGTDRQHSTRAGKHWRQTNLRSILMNRALLGETKAGVVGWEPIMDARRFERLQVLFSDPSRKVTHSPGVKGGKYSMGGGLTVCGACGQRLITAGKARITKDSKYRQVALSCLRRVHGSNAAHPPILAERVVYYDGEGKVVRSKAHAARSERVQIWQDKGRVTIDHDRLERYVFGKVIELVERSPLWQKLASEQDPDVNEKLDALEAERGDLNDQRKRSQRAFVAGIMTERESQREVARIEGELADLDRRAAVLLGAPSIVDMFADGIDWQRWTPGRRRAALQGLIDRVVVSDWPDGKARSLSRRRDETDAELRERQDDYQQEVLAKRVRIVWKWEA